MKRGFFAKWTLNRPGSPSISLTSARVMISMFGCLADSTSLGARIQIEQSLVGKVLSRAAMAPPMAEDFSTK